MTRSISMFTATADLELALTTLAQSALALPREERRLPLARCRELLASDTGHAALLDLCERMGVAASVVPSRVTIDRMFDDELLSMRALKLHRGRNVYSAGKLALWNALWVPFMERLAPDPETIDLLSALVQLRTSDGHADLRACADLLSDRLGAVGFDVERHEHDGHPPLLVARRPALHMRGTVVMYGHYDVSEPRHEDWLTNPWELTERDGRLHGCGVGDNKAALAVRLVAISTMKRCPEIAWLLQGEEERGSPFAHDVLPALQAELRPTVWLEENGYFDPDGTQRVLARVIGASGSSGPPDAALRGIIDTLARDGRAWGLGHRVEVRGLNKDFFPSGCPFNRNLPADARYLAIGVNDPASGIHRPNESVPAWTFALHARQLETVFREVDQIARAAS